MEKVTLRGIGNHPELASGVPSLISPIWKGKGCLRKDSFLRMCWKFAKYSSLRHPIFWGPLYHAQGHLLGETRRWEVQMHWPHWQIKTPVFSCLPSLAPAVSCAWNSVTYPHSILASSSPASVGWQVSALKSVPLPCSPPSTNKQSLLIRLGAHSEPPAFAFLGNLITVCSSVIAPPVTWYLARSGQVVNKCFFEWMDEWSYKQ